LPLNLRGVLFSMSHLPCVLVQVLRWSEATEAISSL
jgi:hypothetical protein